MGTKKGQRRKTARRAYEPRGRPVPLDRGLSRFPYRTARRAYEAERRSGRGKRAKRSERREISEYMSGITAGRDLGNLTAAMGRWWRARFRMFD